VGQEHLFSLKAKAIERADVAVFGIDAILTKNFDVLRTKRKISGSKNWFRRDRFPGGKVMTSGRTRVGILNDVLLDDPLSVVGFTLRRVYVEGPISEDAVISRDAVLKLADLNDVMIVDLTIAEKFALKAT
jgi:hypothetical protein